MEQFNRFGNQQGYFGMNYQPQMQMQVQMAIPGRRIKNPAEIRPNEVPMDGGISYFPTEDMNYIYAKQWNSDGTISTARYIRSDETKNEETKTQSVESEIIERLANIEKMLMEKPSSRKKGVEASE